MSSSRIKSEASEEHRKKADLARKCVKSHPGFTIICKKCGSVLVLFESTLDWDVEDGAWGSAKLECQSCGKETALVSL